jgi:nucleoside-diphosphate-sugar epimerase
MRVLLTGATGFIGSQVARALVRDGCEVHALVRPGSKLLSRLDDLRGKISVVEGDLTRPDELRARLAPLKLDTCVHMAWYVVPGEYLVSPENTRMLAASIDLASILADVGCQRFVGAGTNFEYAGDAGYLSETSPLAPNSLYAASKVALYEVLTQMAKLRGFGFAWARIFYQYGPFESEKRLVPAVIRPLLGGGEARVTAGEQVRDFLHVEDVASAIAVVTQSRLEGAVNIGSGNPITVRDLCLTIADLTGGRARLALGAIPYRPGDPMFVCANAEKLRALGWKPRYDLRSGLESTIAWWKANS